MRIKTCDEVLNKLLEIGDSVDNPADIDVYWKFTDKANLEYARKRGVSEYITFAGLGRVNNKRWPTGAREGSKNAERGAYTPKSLASLCKFLEREFKDCGDCLFVSGDGRALNDIVVENGKVVLVFGRATGCFTRESVENEETKMKKLNITKEQFNRSRYFKNKYGNLEYVSESGKLFKTNKGKVLMFKESASAGFEKFCEELKTKFSDIDGVKIYLMDNEDGSNTITVSIRRFEDARSVWYPEDVKKIGQFIKRKCDRFGWTVDKNVEYRLGITDFYITEIESSNDVVKESFTDRNDIQDNLAAALDAEIRNLRPEDVQFVSESAIDETSVGIIVSLLHSVLTSGELTEEQKMKLMDTKPALLKEMVLDLIDKLLPKTQGYQVLALGLTRAAVQEMTDVDWKDVLKYTLDNLGKLG